VTGDPSAGIAAEVTYRKDVRPLMVQKCLYCHGTEAPYLGDFDENQKKFEAALKGPRMDTYADLVFSSAGLTPAPNPGTGGGAHPLRQFTARQIAALTISRNGLVFKTLDMTAPPRAQNACASIWPT
jgi:hypothetical protein